MNKITLPLVMIASLATLVSCGTTNTDTTSNLPNIKKPVVTGVVVTPVVTTTGMTTNTGSADGTGTMTSSGTTASPGSPLLNTQSSVSKKASVTQTATSPVVLTHKGTVAYNNPSGSDSVEFNVTVTDGIITAASAVPKAQNQISLKRQTEFAANVSAKVVGKKAKDIEVDAIGGSSLTTAAFETFVHSI